MKTRSCATISSACAASTSSAISWGASRRLDAIQGIASDNGADEGEGERGPETEDDDIDDITARDWDDLADELNI